MAARQCYRLSRTVDSEMLTHRRLAVEGYYNQQDFLRMVAVVETSEVVAEPTLIVDLELGIDREFLVEVSSAVVGSVSYTVPSALVAFVELHELLYLLLVRALELVEADL